MKRYHFKGWILLFFIFLMSCNSPNSPTLLKTGIESDRIPVVPFLVIFEWENPVQRFQEQDGVHIQGRLINTGDTIAYHWRGIPKAYQDLEKSMEIKLRIHSAYPDNIRFSPQQKGGHGEWINLYTESFCLIEDIKVLEIKMEYDIIVIFEPSVRYGETIKHTLTYIFE